MSGKNSRTINFLRKNATYFIFIVCLAVLSIVTIALVVSSTDKPVGDGGIIEAPNQDEPSGDTNNDNVNNEDNTNNDKEENKDENQEQKPVVSVIVFDMPVNGTIIKDYVDNGVVYNQTLNLYSGHKAIDFASEEGAVVKAVFQGVIESIETSKLEGTTLILDHGNGLKSVYNSIEVNEDIEVGDSLSKGDSLGVISTNNRLEYKDGAHLHFEVLENGKKIDPYKYLLTEEK